jgi:flagellar biosynthesis protein FlhB
MSQSGQKTEKPTPRRLEKARKDGQFAISREAVVAVQLLVFVYLMGVYGAAAGTRMMQVSRALIEGAFHGEWTAVRFAALWRVTFLHDFALFALGGMLLTVAAFVIQLFSTGFGFVPSKAAPDFSRLDPSSRIMQMPAERLQQFAKSMLVLPLAAWMIWHVMREQTLALLSIDRSPIRTAVAQLFSSLTASLWFAAAVLGLVAAADFAWQKHKIASRLKMSKQEVKDENKESEGNPEIKMRVRRLQRDMARRSMMKELPKATAVIVNPTHYSVAIRYQMDTPGAPVVVAKGKNYLALRIKQRAIEHGIPIVENQPLAQALYKSADVGQEIPAHLYRAVAEVLAYLMKLAGGRPPR